MNTLRLLTPGYFLDEGAVQIVLSSFASFYHELTPKHQRRLKLLLVEEPASIHLAKSLCTQYSLKNVVEVISRSEIERVEESYQTSDFFIYMSTRNQYRIITEALRFSLPIMTLKSDTTKDILDTTCGMLVEKGIESDLIEQCATNFNMLYFDREVCKLLRKGALKKGKSLFGKTNAVI